MSKRPRRRRRHHRHHRHAGRADGARLRPSGDDPLAAGRLGRQPGGVARGSSGVEVRFVARVAAADLDRNHRLFPRLGVEPLLGADPALPSGVLISIVDPDGERSFLTDRGANLNLSAADLPRQPARRRRPAAGLGLFVLYAEAPRAAVMALLQQARERGIADRRRSGLGRFSARGRGRGLPQMDAAGRTRSSPISTRRWSSPARSISSCRCRRWAASIRAS